MSRYPIYVVHRPWAERPLAVFDDKARAALFIYENRESFNDDMGRPEICELNCNEPDWD